MPLKSSPLPRPVAARKAQEVLIAFWLEAWLTKEEILERYLTLAPSGSAPMVTHPSFTPPSASQPMRIEPAPIG